MRVYRPMKLNRGVDAQAPRPFLIVSMSPPDYSLARLRPRRAGLRFIRCAQITNHPIQHRSSLDQTQLFFYSPYWPCGVRCRGDVSPIWASVRNLRTSLAMLREKVQADEP